MVGYGSVFGKRSDRDQNLEKRSESGSGLNSNSIVLLIILDSNAEIAARKRTNFKVGLA